MRPAGGEKEVERGEEVEAGRCGPRVGPAPRSDPVHPPPAERLAPRKLPGESQCAQGGFPFHQRQRKMGAKALAWGGRESFPPGCLGDAKGWCLQAKVDGERAEGAWVGGRGTEKAALSPHSLVTGLR